jgi:hypothetical protein
LPSLKEEKVMKCPKCHYVSFDYNQVCPKCNKDISVEQERLHIPAFKPNPPSLLGGMLGGAQPGARLSASADVSRIDHEPAAIHDRAVRDREPELSDSHEMDFGLRLQEDSQGVDVGGMSGSLFGDSPASQKTSEWEKSGIVDLFSLEEPEVPTKAGEKKEEEDSLDLERIMLEGTAGETGEKAEIDLGDFSLEDAGVNLEKSAPTPSGTEPLLDLGLISGRDGKAFAGKQDEIALNLEDLKVNETGQLEIGKHIPDMPRVKQPPKSQAPVAKVKIESGPAEGKDAEDDLSVLLSDDAVQISGDPGEGGHGLDLENLDLDLDLEGSERK